MKRSDPFTELEWAILQTIAYADVFDYPITHTELQRYLIGLATTPDDVEDALHEDDHLHRYISDCDGYLTLRGREDNVQHRSRHSVVAEQLWPAARHYGQVIGNLPFVRMVAVTGSLAVDNAGPNGDIDYLIITEPGRLWLARLFIVMLVKWAQRQQITLCPNYFLSENALVIEERGLFPARELVQMVPVSGFATYDEIRRLNAWTDAYFPNALDAPEDYTDPQPETHSLTKWLLEQALRTPPGTWLDGWEMQRKIRKLRQQPAQQAGEVDFSADWCKGHFDGHMQRVMTAFDKRLCAIKQQAGYVL